MEQELVEVFGVDVAPSADTADDIYDTIARRIAEPELSAATAAGHLLHRTHLDDRPRDFSDLRHHASLAEQGLAHRIVPTFRPDAVVHLDRPTWQKDIIALGHRVGGGH